MRAGGGRAALLVTLALGLGCRSRPTETGTDAGPARAPVANATLPACEALLPTDVRESMLPGFTMKEERACPSCGPLCTFRSASEKDVTVSVTWDCQPHYAQADTHALLLPSLNMGGEEIPALGRAAARRAPAQGMLQVMAWDDDTPCALVVTWLGGDPEQALDVTRLALTSTRPETVHPTVVPTEPDAGTP
ncbi:hypothetical protein FJV41_48690 [Myxococcus llanfairpwllgwyngyllgogerychwyrndrobwllllantysiliogogogochensis]|uniref:Lipoprotein n=1 Tax=Myxococcus llanfairpwllgwyngyllgogerychwyrndrobwllllantysiliogogogochensis TaxID=2590453 RepID=A0A540WI18_9BACT|nr:hypothetical protein [Myxococcus llanfairpwllgwyngyllgogerychwyrndrobwllllantysiliogogogochensis]TQF08665.1 hypothetical protein FJV41_48690 [Myxococcus llanfairpwllgwyngyllgogerychwyrndrobwllllantysiliogogogochensis]